MLSKRERYIVFFLVVGLIVISGGLTSLFTVLNINPRNPMFFEENNHAVYKLSGEFPPAGVSKASLNVMSLTPSQTTAKVHYGQTSSFKTTPEGRYVSDDAPTDYYTLFWIFLENPMVSAPGSNLGKKYSVVDPIGIISGENEVYTLVVENESMILWSETLSSQASYKVSIYKDNVKVASGIYDATCGLLFHLETHKNGFSSLDLTGTSFPISRNRNYNLAIAIAVITGVLIVVYVWARKSSMSEKKRNVLLNLLAIGFACALVDLYFDLWFFEAITRVGLIAVHLVLAIILYYLIGKWSIPAFFEIGFVLAFAYSYLNGSLVPQIAYFPGLLITWIIMYLLITRKEITV